MNLMKTLVTAGALVVSAQVAQAGDVSNSINGRLSWVVKFEDLDLNRAADANVLHKRLSIAAKRVCVEPKVGDMKAKRIFDECCENAMSEAVAYVNNRNLDEAFLAHKGKQALALSTASTR
jgi:UrcA family protein